MRSFVVWLIATVVASLAGPLGADPGVIVALGAASGAEGQSIEVPLELRSDGGVGIGALSAEIEFDPTALEFAGAHPGASLDYLNGSVLARPIPVSEHKWRLKLGLVTQDPAHIGKALPAGVLAWLSFVPREGTGGLELRLETSAEAASAGIPARAVDGVVALPGRIVVTH